MREAGLGRILGVAAAVACAGCSLFVSLDDGLSGGAEPAVSDGGVTTSASDAGTDAGTAGDGAPPPSGGFCAGHVGSIFCEDFDTSTETRGAFDSDFADNGALQRTTSIVASAPAALEARLESTQAGGEAAAYVSRTVSERSALVAEVKVRIETRTTPGAGARFSELLTLDLLSSMGGGVAYQVGIRAQSSGTEPTLELFGFAAGQTTVLGSRIVIADATWQTFRLRVDLATKTAEVRRMDAPGAPLLTSAPITPPAAASSLPPWKVNVGLYTSGAGTGWRVLFDDVLVTAP